MGLFLLLGVGFLSLLFLFSYPPHFLLLDILPTLQTVEGAGAALHSRSLRFSRQGGVTACLQN